MSEKMTREDVARVARECGIHVSEGNTFADDCYVSVLYRFAHKVIEHFLDTTGQYVTNDASREAAIQAAVEAEREACKQACEEMRGTVSMFATSKDCRTHNNAITCCVKAIRARGES